MSRRSLVAQRDPLRVTIRRWSPRGSWSRSRSWTWRS